MKKILHLTKKIFKDLKRLFRKIAVNADVKILLRKIEKAGWVLFQAFGLTEIFYLWILFVRKVSGITVEEYFQFLWISWFILTSRIVRKKLLKIFKK